MRKIISDKVTTSAKLWWVLTWIIMLTLLAMVGKNFIGSIVYGTRTDSKQIEKYYNNGLSDAKANQGNRLADLNVGNPLFIKAYNKGFRDGLDKKWEDER